MVLGKTPFLSLFLHFFQKIELFRRKTVRINIFPGGIPNSAKKKGQSHFAQKSIKIGKKRGTFWAKLHF
jgi:hypothetical protein